MPKRQFTWNCSCSNFPCAISGFTSNGRAPGGPVTFWWPMWGQRLPKLQNVPIWQNVPKLPKNVQSSKSFKITKNSTSRIKPGILKGVCARVFCECQSVHPRPRQAQEPCPAFPTFSSWLQLGQGPGALSSCPKAQGECLASRELPREVTRPRNPSQCPGMSSGQAQEKLLFQPLEIVPRTEKHMFSEARKLQKNSKLSLLFYLFWHLKS